MNRYMRETLRNSGQPIVQSLKQLCLRCVVDNFERFMLAYDDSDIPPRNFEFLQRTLSKEMLQMLTEASTLKEKYFTFLINPYLKELDLQSFSFSDPEPILERLREVGKSITSLCLNRKSWSEETLSALFCLMPNLEELIAKTTNCTDRVLKVIGKHCRCLKRLDVYRCTFVTNSGIENFLSINDSCEVTENTTLQHLNLARTNVASEGVLLALKHIPSLKTLQHDQLAEIIYERHAGYLTGDSEDPKYNLTNLQMLSLNQYRAEILAGIVKVCAAVCPCVTVLEVEGEINQSVVIACSEFKELSEIKLSSMSDDSSPSLLKPFLQAVGRRLHKLELVNCPVPIAALSEFCSALKSLSLQESEFKLLSENHVRPTAFNAFPHMQELIIDDADFGESVTARAIHFLVASSPNLEILSLPYSQAFSSEVADSLMKCKCMTSLRQINLTSSDIAFTAALKLLLAASELEKFVIRHTEISYAEYMKLVFASAMHPSSVAIVWRSELVDYDDGDLYDEHSSGECDPFQFMDYYDDVISSHDCDFWFDSD